MTKRMEIVQRENFVPGRGREKSNPKILPPNPKIFYPI